MNSGLLKLLPLATAFLCGGGAAETFKEGRPFVGVPMFILGLASFGLWLAIWCRAQSRN